MKPHVDNFQPKKTFKKRVRYITNGGVEHHPHKADCLNWRTEGPGKAVIGAITHYEIIGD